MLGEGLQHKDSGSQGGRVRGRPNKCFVVLGVNALARETGLPKSTISERMRKGQSADQIRVYAAIREGRSPHRASAPVAPRPSLPKFTGAPTEYEAIKRGRERLEAIDDVKLRRARALADKQEIENQQLRSELIPTIYVREWATRFLAYSRDALFKVSELREVLAAETDPIKCNQILRAWVERTLVQFYQLDELWGPTTRK